VRVLIVIVLTAIMLGKPTFAADKIRIGYSGMTISNALLWVTEEGKLFEKNGIDAEVLYLQTTLGQTALLAGEIQMCVYSTALLAAARFQGADVVMVTSFLSRPLYRLVVKPEIRTTADLRGKRLALRVLGPSPTGRHACS
jgi:ABC-type nitrate/sulfonate/bicarbonate transport system substrate-binding protein